MLYTVRWEHKSHSETEEFFRAHYHDEDLRPHLQELGQLLRQIGERTGAVPSFFRHERSAFALPPSGKPRVGQLLLNFEDCPVRLYCLRISNQIVILFNGAKKTSLTAQDGETAIAFREANRLAECITRAIAEGVLIIDEDGKTLILPEGPIFLNA